MPSSANGLTLKTGSGGDCVQDACGEASPGQPQCWALAQFFSQQRKVVFYFKKRKSVDLDPSYTLSIVKVYCGFSTSHFVTSDISARHTLPFITSHHILSHLISSHISFHLVSSHFITSDLITHLI